MTDPAGALSEQDLPEQLEELDPDGCGRLLGSVEMGRLAVVAEGRPRIVVMNHVVDGDDLHFRTREDSLLAALTADGPVPAEFEVDGGSRLAASGWSVIARGELSREEYPPRAAAARRRLRPWAGGDRDVVLRLDVDELSGRHAG